MEIIRAEYLRPLELTKVVKLNEWSRELNREIGVRIKPLSRRERSGGSPRVQPGTPEYLALSEGEQETISEQWEQWGNRIISLACVEPELTAEEADRLHPMDKVALLGEITSLSQGVPEPLRSFRDGLSLDGRDAGAAVPQVADGGPAAA